MTRNKTKITQWSFLPRLGFVMSNQSKLTWPTTIMNDLVEPSERSLIRHIKPDIPSQIKIAKNASLRSWTFYGAVSVLLFFSFSRPHPKKHQELRFGAESFSRKRETCLKRSDDQLEEYKGEGDPRYISNRTEQVQMLRGHKTTMSTLNNRSKIRNVQHTVTSRRANPTRKTRNSTQETKMNQTLQNGKSIETLLKIQQHERTEIEARQEVISRQETFEAKPQNGAGKFHEKQENEIPSESTPEHVHNSQHQDGSQNFPEKTTKNATTAKRQNITTLAKSASNRNAPRKKNNNKDNAPNKKSDTDTPGKGEKDKKAQRTRWQKIAKLSPGNKMRLSLQNIHPENIPNTGNGRWCFYRSRQQHQSTKKTKTTSKTLMPQRWPTKQREQDTTKVACQKANRMPQMWPANAWTGCTKVVCKTVNRMPQRWPIKQRTWSHTGDQSNSEQDATTVACLTAEKMPQRWPVKQWARYHKGGLSNS